MFNNFLSKVVTEQVKQTNMMNDADAEWNTTNYTEVRKKKKWAILWVAHEKNVHKWHKRTHNKFPNLFNFTHLP